MSKRDKNKTPSKGKGRANKEVRGQAIGQKNIDIMTLHINYRPRNVIIYAGNKHLCRLPCEIR